MWKAEITNIASGKVYGVGSYYPTEEAANAWVNKQIGKDFALPERQVPTYDENGNPILDGNGNPVLETLPAEFTSEIVDITAAHNLAQEKLQAQQYLDSTDWYVIRLYERQVVIPSEVASLRLAAVAKLNE